MFSDQHYICVKTDVYKSPSLDIAIAGLKVANCESIHFKYIPHSLTCIN